MTLPPYGLCLPCRVRRVIDGDTVEVSLPGSDRIWPIRLLDCWAPERNTVEGQAAKAFAQRVVDEAEGELSLYVPAPEDGFRLLEILTMGRLLGHIFVGTERTLSQIMVDTGHATRDKQPRGRQ